VLSAPCCRCPLQKFHPGRPRTTTTIWTATRNVSRRTRGPRRLGDNTESTAPCMTVASSIEPSTRTNPMLPITWCCRLLRPRQRDRAPPDKEKAEPHRLGSRSTRLNQLQFKTVQKHHARNPSIWGAATRNRSAGPHTAACIRRQNRTRHIPPALRPTTRCEAFVIHGLMAPAHRARPERG